MKNYADRLTLREMLMSGDNLSRGYFRTINCVGVPLSLCTAPFPGKQR